MEKRSLSIAGHRTSIALEPEFWAVLEEMAFAADIGLPTLIKSIDEARASTNLSSSVRVAALLWTKAQAKNALLAAQTTP